MTHAPPSLPWPRRLAGRVLAPARGVAAWRRAVWRETHGAGRILRLAAWLRELTAAPPALLAEEPLGTLAAVLDRPSRSEEAKRRRAQRRLKGSASSAEGGKRRRDHAHARERRWATALLVPGQPTSIAGATVVLPRAARLRRPLPAAQAPGRGRRVAAAAGAPLMDAPSRALGALLVDRVARRLIAAAPADVDVAAARDRPGEPAPRAAAHAALSFSDATSGIAAQWSAGVSGRAAPRDLLLRLSDTARVAAESRRVAVDEPAPRARPAAPETSRDAPSHSTGDGAPPAEENARSLLSENAVEPRGRTAARRELFRPPLRRVSAAAPPDPLEAVSSDVPAKDLGPQSEAAARLGLTSTEAVSHGDELAVLAGKVKRILDDEARRHGIDV
jgi:hypothetical protein